MDIKNEEELHKRLKRLGKMPDDTRNSVTCSLIGHSKIITGCFGYQYCGRCTQQVGDTLGGVGVDGEVIVGHECPTCVRNYSRLGWKDKVFVPNPFPKEGEPK